MRRCSDGWIPLWASKFCCPERLSLVRELFAVFSQLSGKRILAAYNKCRFLPSQNSLPFHRFYGKQTMRSADHILKSWSTVDLLGEIVITLINKPHRFSCSCVNERSDLNRRPTHQHFSIIGSKFSFFFTKCIPTVAPVARSFILTAELAVVPEI